MAKKQNNYFQMFVEVAEDAIKAAQLLDKSIKTYNPEKNEKMLKAMHDIEHGADIKKHEMMKLLAEEFITPIEREDIIALSWELDNVLDLIEEVCQMFYMFNVQEMRPYAIDFSELITRSTVALAECFKEFENFRKSQTISGAIVEVNVIEELADTLYIKSVRELFTKEKDPVKVNAWNVLYNRLEKIVDSCENVADSIGSVIMKNS